MKLDKLLNFWKKVVTGEKFDEKTIAVDDPELIKDLLYDNVLASLPKVIDSLKVDLINYDQNKADTLKEIFEASCEIASEPWPFFLQRIMQTKKATCAGNTLLVNYLLNRAGIDFEYGRPQGHSMNFA